jgi:hypothetical protein
MCPRTKFLGPMASLVWKVPWMIRPWTMCSDLGYCRCIYHDLGAPLRSALGWRTIMMHDRPLIVTHRIDFFSSPPNWDPSPAGDCVPPSLVPGGHTRWREMGPNSDKGTDIVILSVYMYYVLWLYVGCQLRHALTAQIYYFLAFFFLKGK